MKGGRILPPLWPLSLPLPVSSLLIYDTVKQNYIRVLDEFTKAQPQYTQSVSNLQLDYIAATKNTIQNMVSAQKMLASNGNVPIVTPHTQMNL